MAHNPTKDQYCLRNMPLELWDWLEQRARSKQESINETVISLLSESRSGPTLFDTPNSPSPTPTTADSFRFIDLFAGIGGFRVGLQRLGGRCVFTSEWDRWAQKTYAAWHGELPVGDINEVDLATIPNHDVLAAGFPCQPFSIAGVSKKRSLGQADGFRCERQGNLFFRICDVIDFKRPPVLILENVKNLQSHDQRRTWAIIRAELESRQYLVKSQIIDAAAYVPQHRERILIVCFDRGVFGDAPPFKFPDPPEGPRPVFRSILEPKPAPEYTLTDHLWNYLQNYAKKHQAKGNGFGFGLAPLDGVSRTLSARYYKDGSEVLIPQDGKNPRRLTIVEAARLMGFADFVKRREDMPVSDTQAYRQFGNSVVPAVVEAVGREVLTTMRWARERITGGCLLKGLPTEPTADGPRIVKTRQRRALQSA